MVRCTWRRQFCELARAAPLRSRLSKWLEWLDAQPGRSRATAVRKWAWPRLTKMSSCATLLLLTTLAAADLPAPWRAAIEAPRADSLRGHVSFLASDLLEGRDTPSRGLDIAAEYIAAQFRRAGLRPVGDDGYFQTTTIGGAKVRNVIGVIDGSDPKLKNTYVLVTAHYDHLGVRPN